MALRKNQCRFSRREILKRAAATIISFQRDDDTTFILFMLIRNRKVSLCHCRLLLFSRRRTRFAQLATIVQDSPTDPPFETTARFTLRTLFHIPPFAIIPRVILGSHMSANRRLSSLEIISRRVFSASSFRPGFMPPFSQYIRRGRGQGRSPPSLLAFFSRSAIEDRFPREKRKESSVARSSNRPRLRGTLIRARENGGKLVGKIEDRRNRATSDFFFETRTALNMNDQVGIRSAVIHRADSRHPVRPTGLHIQRLRVRHIRAHFIKSHHRKPPLSHPAVPCVHVTRGDPSQRSDVRGRRRVSELACQSRDIGNVLPAFAAIWSNEILKATRILEKCSVPFPRLSRP